MPLDTTMSMPSTEPAPSYLTLTTQKRGVITLIDKSKLPKDALEEAINLYLYEDGNAGPRPGVDWYGVALPNGAEIDGFDYFDFAGVIHIVAVGGGNIYRSTTNALSWELCSGGTMIAGTQVNFNQNGAFLYITNGQNIPLRYNGTTILQAYSALTTPGAPTVTPTGITGTTYTYWYKVAAVNDVGYTDASAATSVQTNSDYITWANSNGAKYVTVTHPAVTGAKRYDYYRSDNNQDYYYVGSSQGTNTNFVDNGQESIPSTVAPNINTTTGELYAEYKNIGARQFGIRHKTNRYQIGYTSGNEGFTGSFSPSSDSGSVSWQKGGKYIPMAIEDYRDGKGSPVATIWCDSADGQGCVIQMTLDQLTVGSLSYTIPNLYKLPGSRGTPAAGSVVNVLNDYMFYNSQAVYNIGNRANLQQIISTDEVSANIRPTVKQTSTAAERGIVAAYFDARVLISVPRGSTKNNKTMVYDTERQAWLPEAFDMGFKRFLRYTSTESDGSKTQRLLCLRPGDNRISEISSGYESDYGQPFMTSLKTGLYPTTQNRFDFQFTEEAEIELANPKGQIFVELLGIERSKGFTTTKQQSISSKLTNTGWSTRAWSTRLWSDTSDAPTTYSESSVKRYFTVQKELNAVQWHIFTSSVGSKYTMRTLQTWGTQTYSGKPRQWRLV